MRDDDDEDGARDSSNPVTATYVSLMLRELEMRRDPTEDPKPTEKALAYDDHGNPLLGEAIPWSIPRAPDPPPPSEHASRQRDHVAKRNAYIHELYRKGYSIERVVMIVSEKHPGGPQVIRREFNRLAKMYTEIDKRPDIIAERKAQMREEWQELEDEARAKGDLVTVRYAKDRRTKLDGLYAPQKIEHSVEVTVGLQIEKVVDALDERGLEALEIVLSQLAAKGLTSAQLPTLPPADVIDIVADDVNSDQAREAEPSHDHERERDDQDDDEDGN